METWTIITAAGTSSRMGNVGNKLMLELEGKPLICTTVQAFVQAGFNNIVVVVPPQQLGLFEGLLTESSVVFAMGGSTRQESVYNGLLVLPPTCTHVLIHDGARPFVSASLIQAVNGMAYITGACIPVVSMSDTIYEVGEGQLVNVLQRDKLGAVQTPQGFELKLIMEAHWSARRQGLTATDDAALVKLMGREVAVLPGEHTNRKITRPEDLSLLQQAGKIRVGFGMDVHRLVEGRPLILGGVRIPAVLGLLGHSDADVVIHAVMDALLGSIGLGDIGKLFPDTDERYKGANSLELLRHVSTLLQVKKAQVENIDVTLLLESPKIAPYKDQMRANIAMAVHIAAEQVNIKATTNEGLGYVGAHEGAVCYAVATVCLKEPVVGLPLGQEDSSRKPVLGSA